jgi:hypothetical protein
LIISWVVQLACASVHRSLPQNYSNVTYENFDVVVRVDQSASSVSMNRRDSEGPAFTKLHRVPCKWLTPSSSLVFVLAPRCQLTCWQENGSGRTAGWLAAAPTLWNTCSRP